ncbi:MAG: hypothetical protein M3388_11805 [Acidobacteriota bacterium]|nr:hypothetical protein [Acidobacteriota bacterium]
MTAEEAKNTALIIYGKDKKYYGDAGEESTAVTLKTDALYDAPCVSDAGVIHLFRRGKFEAL